MASVKLTYTKKYDTLTEVTGEFGTHTARGHLIKCGDKGDHYYLFSGFGYTGTERTLKDIKTNIKLAAETWFARYKT